MTQAESHNQTSAHLAESYEESAATERRLASHCATVSDRERHLRRARRFERKAEEAKRTRV